MRHTTVGSSLLVFICLAACAHAAAGTTGTAVTLVVLQPTSENAFTVEQLEARLKTATVRFVHPYYEKEKSFEGFPMGPFIGEFFDEAKTAPADWTVQFTALDGYQATVAWARLAEPGGYLVFRDTEMPGWEKMKNRNVSPGPFAIVWVGKEQTWRNGYPWPWQIVSMRLIKGPGPK